MDALRIVLIVLEVIASLALILVVLVQSGKEAGLSGAISGNSETYMSKTGGSWDKKLASWTEPTRPESVPDWQSLLKQSKQFSKRPY